MLLQRVLQPALLQRFAVNQTVNQIFENCHFSGYRLGYLILGYLLFSGNHAGNRIFGNCIHLIKTTSFIKFSVLALLQRFAAYLPAYLS